MLADTVPTIGTDTSAVELNRCNLPREFVPSAGTSAQYIVAEGDGVRRVLEAEAVLVALLLDDVIPRLPALTVANSERVTDDVFVGASV